MPVLFPPQPARRDGRTPILGLTPHPEDGLQLNFNILDAAVGKLDLAVVAAAGGGLPAITLPADEQKLLRVSGGVPQWSSDLWRKITMEQLVLPVPTLVGGVPTADTDWGIAWGHSIKARLQELSAGFAATWRYNWKADDSRDNTGQDGWGVQLSTGGLAVQRRTATTLTSPLQVFAGLSIVDGGFQLSDLPAPIVPAAGTIKWSAGHFQGYDGTAWHNLDGASGQDLEHDGGASFAGLSPTEQIIKTCTVTSQGGKMLIIATVTGNIILTTFGEDTATIRIRRTGLGGTTVRIATAKAQKPASVGSEILQAPFAVTLVLVEQLGAGPQTYVVTGACGNSAAGLTSASVTALEVA